MDQTFRVLQEALCEAHCKLHAKMTLQAVGGSSDSTNVTESRIFRFSQVSQVSQLFPSFAGPGATADRRCPLHIDAQSRQ